VIYIKASKFSVIFDSFVKKIQMVETKIKNIILNILKDYNPSKVGIFGSFARGDNKSDSDIDILVEFKEPPSLLTLIKIENDLSELLGIKVDLVTTGALKNSRIKRSIKKDLINIL
jgi:predicted nucleotidyltransferase